MTDAMENLFQYAQEQLVHSLLLQDPEYSNAQSRVNRQEEALRALLDEKTTESFEKTMSERGLLDFIYERALFCAGFRVAFELLR